MPKIIKPVIIIGCPRSGTSLLFRILSSSKHLWSLYRESNDIWEAFYKRVKKVLKDETLNELDLTEEQKNIFLNEFHKHTLNNYYLGYFTREFSLKREPLKPLLQITCELNFLYKKFFLKEYRILEKTPKNCFRISFINSLFEDCKFIYLSRDGRANISSLIEGWKAVGKFIREETSHIHVDLKGYNGKSWKFVLPPGWEDYTDKSLEEVCAFQWISSNKAALEGLKQIEANRKKIISYEELIREPYNTTKNLCEFIEIPFSKTLRNITKNLPMVNVVSEPEQGKWRKNVNEIKNVYPVIESMMKELGYKLDD